MSYISERTAGVRQHYLTADATRRFLSELGFTGLTGNLFNNNNTVSYKGRDYTLKNNSSDTITIPIPNGTTVTTQTVYIPVYNMYDVIALAKQCDFSDEDIVAAIDEVNKANRTTDDKRNLFWHGPTQSTEWTKDDVKAVNTDTLPAMSKLVDKLNQQYPGCNAQVVTRLDANGVTYTYELTYTDPASGKEYAYPITTDDLHLNSDGTVDDKNLNTWINSHPVGAQITANNNAQNNADASIALGEAVQSQFEKNPNLGIAANTNRVLSQSEKDKALAKEPGTDNLNVWNRDKDTSTISTVSKNLGKVTNVLDEFKNSTYSLDNPDKPKKLDTLQKLADTSNTEAINTILRGVDNQQTQLLEQIRNDPELYRTVVQQLRNDSANNVIAGQRAANIKDTVEAQGTEYDAAADKLYSSLFGGDSSVAQAARDTLFKTKASALDVFTQEQLNTLRQAGYDATRLAQDIATAAGIGKTALDVEEQAYADEAALNVAKADVNTLSLISQILGNAKTDREKNDALLNWINDNLTRGEKELSGASGGSADVSGIVGTTEQTLSDPDKQTIVNAILQGYTPGKGMSATTDLESILGKDWQQEIAPTKFENKQYQDAVADTKLPEYRANADLLTKQYTEQELLDALGLGYLAKDSDKLAEMYTDFSTEANEKSNQVFNAAQRAYIAAITAGDVKTTEQLTRLAETTSGAKRNVYAATALADQFKKQRGLSGSGKQLATDFNNQMSANNKFIADNKLAAESVKQNYRGNGSDSYDKATFLGGYNALNNAGSLNSQTFADYDNALMSTTSKLGSTNTGVATNNYKNLGDVAGTISDSNFENLINNIRNDRVREDIKTRYNALINSGNSVKNNKTTNP